MKRVISPLVAPLILLLAVCILSGCATTRIDRNSKLEVDEGILVLKLHTNESRLSVNIFDAAMEGKENNRGVAYFYYRDLGEAKDKDDLLGVIKLRQGKYYIANINEGSWMLKTEPIYFDIEAGKVNYVGDLVVLWAPFRYWTARSARVGLVDNEKKTLSEVRERFDWLLDSYPYKKKLGKMTLNTVDGFKEEPELKEKKIPKETPKKKKRDKVEI